MEITQELYSYANEEKAKILSGFFKTAKGQYGEGDKFIGVTVPNTRIVAKKYKETDLKKLKELLEHEVHEMRLLGVLILVEKFKKNKKEIFEFYLKNRAGINNWDLVDASADKIVGGYLFDKDKELLYTFAKSKKLWERRIAIISTFCFIKKNDFEETFKIAEILLNDKHDLIQKAVGWMLREIGKRDQKREEEFLLKHYKKMPRTMLRYAIEKFDEEKRKFYMGP